jgi:hypothetical protein
LVDQVASQGFCVESKWYKDFCGNLESLITGW